MSAASEWVVRFGADVDVGGPVLDVACGDGRHTRLFLALGHPVVAIDRDVSGLADLAANPALRRVEADLEDGGPLPFAGEHFAAVVVTNYLYRPILADLVDAVGDNGLLIYETFAAGNERFGRPSRPEYLLRPEELLDAVRGTLQVVAYEDVILDAPRPAAVQRIAARRPRR